MPSPKPNVVSVTVSLLLSASAAFAASPADLASRVQSVSPATGKLTIDGQVVYVTREEAREIARLRATKTSSSVLSLDAAYVSSVDGAALGGSLGTGATASPTGSAASSSKQSRLAKLRSRINGALRATWAAFAARMNFQPHDSKSQFSRGLM